MYKVIHYFTDLQDFNHPYNVGDIFPRNGLKVSEDRLKELSTSKNRQKKPLIMLISEEKTKYKKTDINKMSTSELKELARAESVENAEEMTGVELKKVLIDLFGL